MKILTSLLFANFGSYVRTVTPNFLLIKDRLFIIFVFLFSTSIGISQTGILDPSFATNGFSITEFGNYNTTPRVLRVLPNGKILTLCRVYQTSQDIGLAKYNSDGSLDTSFGTDGKLMIDLNNGSAENPIHMELLSSGKILINGTTGDDLFLLRLEADGSIDSSFATNGYLILDVIAGTLDISGSFAMRPSGEIVMVSSTYGSPGGGSGTFIQFTENGALDVSFGTNGILLINNVSNAQELLLDIALSPSGDAYAVAAVSQINNTDNTYVYCVSPDGTLNTTFNGLGYRLLPIGTNEDSPRCIAVSPNGQVVVAGETELTDDSPFVAKLEADGSYDISFGTDGVQLLSSIYSVAINDMIIDPDGMIVLTGQAYLGFTSNILIARLNTNGSFDSGFGTGGYTMTLTGETTGEERGISLVSDANGNYLMSAIGGQPISSSVVQIVLKYGSISTNIEEFNSTEIQLYPNPSNGTFVIKGLSPQFNQDIEIYDVSGRVVANVKINDTGIIEIPSSLSSGLYFVGSEDRILFPTQPILLVR